MPELPEVETLRRDLVPLIEGKCLESVAVRRRDLRFPLPRGFAQKIRGQKIVALGRRGKYLLLHLGNEQTAICHLGMSGQLLATRSNAPDTTPRAKHEHLIFFLEGGVRLGFIDPRRFGFWALCPTEKLTSYPSFSKMGPEPLDADFTGAILRARLHGKSIAIKPALLDQRVVAGIGNIYASEALFYARVSPLTQAGRLSPKRCQRLAQAIQQVLRSAVRAGGSTRQDYRRADATSGWFQQEWAVYERAGQACPACACAASRGGTARTPTRGRGVRRLEQAGRATFYCPHKQG